MKKFLLIFSFLLLKANTFTSFSYEKWKFNNELLGISKISLNYQLSNFYYGIGFLGAAEGKRGGFFTFGYQLGMKYYILNRFFLQPELYIGAGGGGGAPQGGGLMIREALSVNYNINNFDVGAGYSYVNFLNGNIKSSQVFMNINAYNFENILKNKKFIITFPLSIYIPKSQVITTDNKKQEKIYLIGVDIKSILNNFLFTNFNLNGAYKTSNGYMDIFIGGGFYKKFLDNFTFYFKGAVGEGGGGKVKTDGGLLFKTSLNLEYQATNSNVSFEYGLIHNSSFKSKVFSVLFGIRENFDELIEKLTFKPVIKIHFNTNKGVQYLEGLSIDYFISKNIYISGKSLWAFAKNSGGYTEGLIGIGINKNITKKIAIIPEIFAGAAGGGGIDVGSGYLYGANLKILYKLNKINPFIGAGFSKFSNRITKDVLLGVDINF